MNLLEEGQQVHLQQLSVEEIANERDRITIPLKEYRGGATTTASLQVPIIGDFEVAISQRFWINCHQRRMMSTQVTWSLILLQQMMMAADDLNHRNQSLRIKI